MTSYILDEHDMLIIVSFSIVLTLLLGVSKWVYQHNCFLRASVKRNLRGILTELFCGLKGCLVSRESVESCFFEIVFHGKHPFPWFLFSR